MKTYQGFFNEYSAYSGGGARQHPLPSEFVMSLLEEKENGVFVDVGAHDGISWSNTLLMEAKFGWTGLCIEANESLFKELQASRTSVCRHYAIDESETEQTFWSIVGYASGLGGLEKGFLNNHAERVKQELVIRHDSTCEKITMTTKRLAPILAAENITHIDYLSIDVEGNELGVLKSIDFNSCSCTLISVESNNRKSVQAYLKQFGYTHRAKICADDIYGKT
jgi:FkbM family methyltransferase